ncbi:hypothetical protein IMZ48_05500, partial [Candidatus Bathyarchaeota archaeon]|nr:hypothetical protein [Candidatus Bathyarchaeota archaeon]
CGCGQDKRPGHIAFCREVRQLSDQRWPKELFHHAGGRPTRRMQPDETLYEVMTNGAAFAALAKASDFFTKICPHVSTQWREESPETE